MSARIDPGTLCQVNGDGDLYMEAEFRPFINKSCVVQKITKSGLVHVSLVNDPTRTISVPRKNIDIGESI